MVWQFSWKVIVLQEELAQVLAGGPGRGDRACRGEHTNYILYIILINWMN
jgi:hypothetical protein